jgi:hypothetical protein
MTKAEKRIHWRKIEEGEIPDDYQNPFLSHFGFMDYPLDSIPRENKSKKLKRYYGIE